MNKIIIPTLLIAIVVAVGFFAFSPVEQASTVHTVIANEAMIPFKIACNEILLTDASDDGEITLDVNGDNPVIVKAIYFESGTGGGVVTGGADTVQITDIRVDTVILSSDNAASIGGLLYDAAPTEGNVLGQIDGSFTENNRELYATTDIGVTVDGTEVNDNVRYIVTFAGYRVSGDTAPTCDITGVQ